MHGVRGQWGRNWPDGSAMKEKGRGPGRLEGEQTVLQAFGQWTSRIVPGGE